MQSSFFFFCFFYGVDRSFNHLSFFMFCRKEVKDPDVLYNMLKNLLAQIKVSDIFNTSQTPATKETIMKTFFLFIIWTDPPWRLAIHGTSEEIRSSRLLRDHSLSHRWASTCLIILQLFLIIMCSSCFLWHEPFMSNLDIFCPPQT